MKNLLKNILIVLIICLTTMLSISFATTINGMTEEEIRIKYEEIKKERQRLKNARNSKFEIIKNNNVEIEKLKQEALNEISKASKKVDNLMYQIKNNQIVMTQEIINELTQILQILQTSNDTIKTEAKSLQEIVKMVKYKGYDSTVLTVLDNAIEKQNSIIVSYKLIISNLQGL